MNFDIIQKLIDKKKIDLEYANESGNAGITAIFRDMGIKIVNKVFGTGEVEGSKYINYKLALNEDEKAWGIHRVRIGD